MLRKLKKIFLIIHKRVFSRGYKKSCTFVARTSEVSTKTDFSLIYMPLSSKRSVTGALQASNAGSSPASGTNLARWHILFRPMVATAL